MSEIDSCKTLDKDKLLDWVYNGNAAGFTIGEFTSLINIGYFNSTKNESLLTTIDSLKGINTKQTEVFEKIKSESDKFMSLLNITFETHPAVEDQAKAYNSLIESQKEEIERLQKENNYLLECQEVIESVQGMDADGNMPESTRCKHGFNANLFCVQCIDEEDKQKGATK